MGKKKDQGYEQLSLEGMPEATPTTTTPDFDPRITGYRNPAQRRSLAAHAQQVFASSPKTNRTYEGADATYHHIGDQLKAFMTPKEITDEWQANDPDRHEAYGLNTNGTDDSRAGEVTRRAIRSDGQTNKFIGFVDSQGNTADWRPRAGLAYRRPGITTPMPKSNSEESDEQLYDRKAEEAYDYGATGGHASLADSIIAEGVKDPIRLGLRMGSQGKPQLVGGHHRLAVSRESLPGNYQPVLYHESMQEARSPNTTQYYPYR